MLSLNPELAKLGKLPIAVVRFGDVRFWTGCYGAAKAIQGSIPNPTPEQTQFLARVTEKYEQSYGVEMARLEAFVGPLGFPPLGASEVAEDV